MVQGTKEVRMADHVRRTSVIHVRRLYIVDTSVARLARITISVPRTAKSRVDKSVRTPAVVHIVRRRVIRVRNRVHGKLIKYDHRMTVLILILLRQCRHHVCNVPCGSVSAPHVGWYDVLLNIARCALGFRVTSRARSFCSAVTAARQVMYTV